MCVGRTLAMFAGICLFGFSQLAYADVVTRSLNITLNAEQIESYDLDVDSNGTTDFTFETAFVLDPVLTIGFDQTRVPFASPNGVVIDSQTGDGFPTASLLGLGSVVGPANLFSTGSFDLGNLYSYDPFNGETGNFGGQRGYLGLSFVAGGQTYYGFADIAVNSLTDATPFDLTVFSVSYNNVAGQAITVAVPEPSSIFFMELCVLVSIVAYARQLGWFHAPAKLSCR